jgi:hypothetical protein
MADLAFSSRLNFSARCDGTACCRANRHYAIDPALLQLVQGQGEAKGSQLRMSDPTSNDGEVR